MNVLVEGHGNVPQKHVAISSNWELSLARGARVARYLVTPAFARGRGPPPVCDRRSIATTKLRRARKKIVGGISDCAEEKSEKVEPLTYRRSNAHSEQETTGQGVGEIKQEMIVIIVAPWSSWGRDRHSICKRYIGGAARMR
jgi:hypothetical protein